MVAQRSLAIAAAWGFSCVTGEEWQNRTAVLIDSSLITQEWKPHPNMSTIMGGITQEWEIVTCEFSLDLGPARMSCVVPGARNKCCNFQKAYIDCMLGPGPHDEACYHQAFVDSGFDPEETVDSTYLDKSCPVMVSLAEQENVEQYCNVTENPGFHGENALLERDTCVHDIGFQACEIPNVKRICCELLTAFAPCANIPDPHGCLGDALEKTAMDMISAGVDLDRLEDETYWDEFCPTASKWDTPQAENVEKYCVDNEPLRRFSIQRPRFGFVRPFMGSKRVSSALAGRGLVIVGMAGLGLALVGLAITRRVTTANRVDELELEPVFTEESLIA